MSHGSPRLQAFVVRVYGALLRLYPEEFQRACGAPMLETFEAVCRERAARLGTAAYAFAALADLGDALSCAWHARRAPGRCAVAKVERAGDTRMMALWHDSLHAGRRLLAQPALVTFTVLTLGFAIAANAALFSIVDAVLLRPSPFAGSDRLVNVVNYSPRGFTYPGLNPDKLREWRSQRDIFDAVEAYRPLAMVVTGGVEPQEVQAAQMSPGLVALLGVPPHQGRLFTDADTLEGRDRVVLVSERFWRMHLGGEPSAVGRPILINGASYEVIGVMPARFHFPSLAQQLWLPMDPVRMSRSGGPAITLARLQEGLAIEAAQERINSITAQLEQAQPIPSGWSIRLRPDTITRPPEQVERAVLVLFGAVGLVLLTACANVANVLLSRAVDRRREFAIRLALGAGRGRLVRELGLEGLLLGASAALVGLAAAHWSLETLVRLAPASLSFVTTTPIAVDGRVIAFGVLLAVITGIVCNVPPALRLLNARGTEALSGRTSSEAATPLHRRMRAALVVVEVGLSVMLLVGAALMARSFAQLNAIELGFDPDNLLAVTLGIDSHRYETVASQVALLEDVAAGVARLPGVEGVAVSSGLPPHAGDLSFAAAETDAGLCGDEPIGIVSNLVTPAYFHVARIALIEGRPLREDDPREAVVISRALARHCRGETLVGRRLRLGPAAPWLTIVGVSADVRALGLKNERGDLSVYSALSAGTFLLPNMATRIGDSRFVSRRLAVRTDRPGALLPDVKRLLWSIDATVPVLSAGPATEFMADTIRSERFMLTLMTLFSTVALALASAGIFGVLAYAVAQRTREIGLRMALGATPRAVLRLVVGQGMALAGIGVLVGLAGAFALSRLLASLLYEVDPRDPIAFAMMGGVVLTVTLLACAVPAIRACRIDPATALRHD